MKHNKNHSDIIAGPCAKERKTTSFTNRPEKKKSKSFKEHLKSAYFKSIPIRHYILRGHISRTLTITKYLKNNKKTKLQVGCGPNALIGWLNADIISGNIYLNAKRKMPFKAKTFDFVFCEHFIEHLTRESGLKFLNECHRILKTGGVHRITSPDLEKIIDLYYDRNVYVKRQKLIEQYGKCADLQLCELFNDYMHNWGHKFIYDRKTIAQTLFNIGFIDITFCEYKKSSYSELSDLERHLEEYSLLNLAETFVVEAKK